MPHPSYGSASPHGGADPRCAGEASVGLATDVDPRPEAVRVELARIETRWAALPLTAAEAGMPAVRLVLDQLTAASGQDPVPELGPGTALHQLKVLAWEAARQGRADGIPDLLADLRRSLP